MMFKFCTCVNFKPESSDEERQRDSPARKLERQKELIKEAQNAPLSPSARSQRPDYQDDRLVNLDAGDPTMFETYWKKIGKKATVVIPGWRSMSYYSGGQSLCWFLEPELCQQILRLHRVVGNAVTEGRYIVVGTGSSQLILASLYALSSPDSPHPTPVLSAAPYYSSYPSVSEFMRSSLFRWGGDATTYDQDHYGDDNPYIEMVTSPNNPDGSLRAPVVNRSGGKVVHDLAYYWPHYTPITAPANHDLALFTASKCTGHAGSRIGWALVKDPAVASKMVKFIELNSIGVSKDSQLRTARILSVISESCEQASTSEYSESFYGFGHRLMTERWRRLRQAVKHGGMFSMPEFPSAHCNFLRRTAESRPAFAWMKCEGDEEDCASLLQRHKIVGRSGVNFGCSAKFVRVSMVDRDDNFDLLVQRISKITSPSQH